jgi:hypothetical protein
MLANWYNFNFVPIDIKITKAKQNPFLYREEHCENKMKHKKLGVLDM